MFSTKHCLEQKKAKMIGHHSRLRDVMGQSHPIYACARANQNYNKILERDWLSAAWFEH